MPKIQFDKLMVSGDFTLAARSIVKRTTSIKVDMQKALICSLEFTATHGDHESSILVMLDAAKGMGKNLHRAAVEWVLAFSWLALDDASKTGYRKDQSKVMKIAEAKEQLWWEMEKAPSGKPFDLQKAIQTLFDRIKSEADAGRLKVDEALSAVTKAVSEANPEFIVDAFEDLTDSRKNELLAVLVARMNPAPAETPTVEVDVEEPAAAAA